MSTLDDILNDEAEIDTPEIETVEEPQGQPRDETGRFAPKGETESASPAPVEDRQAELDHPALIAERRRRQEADAEREQLRAQIAAMQAAQQPYQEPPSIWDDENAWQNELQSRITQQAVQAATQESRVNMSEMLARQAHTDFDAMKEVFVSLANQNPALGQQCLQDPHPWNKAYQIAKNHKTMQELGATDIASLEAKLTEKIRAELTAQQPAPSPQFPTSLAGSQSARGGSQAPGGPPSLNDILRS